MCFEGRLYNRSSVNDPPFCAPNLMAIYNDDLKPFFEIVNKRRQIFGSVTDEAPEAASVIFASSTLAIRER
jgi:hypothetical protein